MKQKEIISGLAIVSAVLMLAGCVTQGVPPSARQALTPGITFVKVRDNPDPYLGSTVMWAGEVLTVKNEEKRTVLEILEVPCDRNGEPRSREKSEGRFIAIFDQYLDEAVYQAGRSITVVGKLQGTRRQPLGSGKVDYAYPLVEGHYIYLWPRPQNITVYDPPYWNNRYYWNGSPYWDPWWGTRPYPVIVHPRDDHREDGHSPHRTDGREERKR